MKKSILFLICSAILIALNGCTDGRVVFSQREISDTSDTLESVGVETESEIIGTQSELNSADYSNNNISCFVNPDAVHNFGNDTSEINKACGYEQINLSDFTVVSEYEIDDYCDTIINKWNENLKAQNLNSSVGYSLMGEYVFIEKTSEEYLGCTDYIIMNANDFFVLSDVYSEGNPLLFMYNDHLYIYNYFLKNGIVHSYYTVYDLNSKSVESSYAELYNLGEPSVPFDIIPNNSEFSGFGEVAEDIKSKTNTLFRIQYITNIDNDDI